MSEHQPPATQDVMKVDEVASWLRVNRKTIYDAVERGDIPSRRLGRRVILSRTAIQAWLGGTPSTTRRANAPMLASISTI